MSVIELEQEGVGDFTRTLIGIEEALEAHQERVHRALGIGEQHPQQTDGQLPRRSRRLRRMRGPQDSSALNVPDVITTEAESALDTLGCHKWYMAEHMVLFDLFSDNVM